MRLSFAIIPMFVALAGCSGDDAPTGQVLATVNGTEITSGELNAEMGGIRARNPAEQRQLQREALQSIVNRTLLAQAAAEQGVNDGPTAAITKRRAEQLAVISLFEQQLRGRVPNVSTEEAEQFISDNPAMFRERRIFLVDQIIVPAPPPALLRALEPLDTMTQVQAELARFNLPTRSTFGVIDAVTMDPSAVRQIAALAPDAVFILPADGSIRINRVRDSQIEPIAGTDAINVATEMLRNQRIQQQVTEAVNGVLQRGQANVRYNPAYQPPATPARRAPAAGAAPAGATAPATTAAPATTPPSQ